MLTNQAIEYNLISISIYHLSKSPLSIIYKDTKWIPSLYKYLYHDFVSGYGQMTQCSQSGTRGIERCQRRSEQRMAELQSKQPVSQMSSAGYYAEFCE